MSKKTQDALRKYYSTFDYGTGVKAYKRGGQMGFGKQYWPGGALDDPRVLYGIYYGNLEKPTTFKNEGLKGLAGGKTLRTPVSNKFDFADWLSDNAGTAVALGSAAMSAIGQAGLTRDFDSYEKEVNAINPNSSNVRDNDAVLNWYNNNPYLSDTTASDFRSNSVWDDIKSAAGAGFSAGLTTMNPWVGIGAAALSGVGSLIGRARAKSASDKANELNARKNKQIDTALFHAAGQADANNDFMRMLGYYNDPFEYALGGEMRSHGSDWNDGLTFINAGGRHETNPYEGVPSGVDDEGVPNLVEEGEVIWNNEYVFSDRLKVPKELANKYSLGGDKTFAEAIEEVTKESRTRPNDPISNETNRAIVNEFMDAQEALREEQQTRAARQVQMAYDEDFMNQLAAMNQGGMPMQEGIQLPPQGMSQEGVPIEGAPAGFALGGNKFDDGSWKRYATESTDSNGNTIYTTSDGRIFYSEAGAQKYIELNKERLVSNLSNFEASPIPARIIANRTGVQLPRGIKAVYSKGRNGQKGQVYHYETSDGLNMGTNRNKAVQHQTRLNQGNTQVAAAAKVVSSPSFQDINIFSTPDSGFDLFSNPPQDYVSAPVAQAAQPQNTSVPAEEQVAAVSTTSNTAQASGKTSGRASGSTGSSIPSGNTIDYNRKLGLKASREWEAQSDYQNFLKYMRGQGKDSPEAKQWMDFIQDEIRKSGSSYTLKDFNDWSHLAEDGKIGPVHKATLLAAQNYAKRQNAPQLEGPSKVTTTPKEGIDLTPRGVNNTPATTTRGTSPTVTTVAQQRPQFNYKDTWMRDVPIWAGLVGAGYGLTNTPNYENADAVIEAARAAGAPVDIPVQTIGDYRRRNPFDERYLVNMANQNMAAGQRALYNTSSGNRSMDMLGAMNLAYNNQGSIGEIMRQAYLANRQDDAQVAEFNRGTNIQNMNAINHRNLAQAQLNSQRQSTALSGLARGYAMRQGIKDAWDNTTMQSINSAAMSAGLKGRENEQDNMLMSMAEHGYFPYFYRDRGIMDYARPAAKGGRKSNKKKRRF